MSIEELEKQRIEDEKVIHQTGLLRLVALIAMVIFLMAGLKEKVMMLYILSFVSVIALIFLVQKQNKAYEHLKRVNVQIEIKEKIKCRQNDQWQHQQFKENIIAGPHYLEDLDVLGPDSLYDYLNFSYHQSSQKRLEERLSQPLKTKAEIETMQNVFKDLKSRAMNYLVEEGCLSKKERIPLTAKEVEPILKMPLYLKLLTYFYPVILVLSAIFFSKVVYYLMLLGIVVSGLHFSFWQQGYELTSRKIEATQCFNHLIKNVSKEVFESPWLISFQEKLNAYAKQKHHLEIIDQLLKFRFNPLLMVLLNALCFYDGWLYLALEKQQDDTYLLDLQDALADYSALCSMAMWFEMKADTTFPVIKNELKAVDLKHPLMQSKKAVGADFCFVSGAVVITGSNMAGKTTFMRNLGLNLILCYCGLSVDAKMFEVPILEIYTSMRVADRTQEGISTFYGELLRIKEMVQCAKARKPALFLIDEIFKGTNLKDRIIGAQATIEKLSYPNAFLFVSTHDEALTRHENVDITNIHFEESYIDDQVVFDYRMKQGPSKTTNAKYLMKMIGILE